MFIYEYRVESSYIYISIWLEVSRELASIELFIVSDSPSEVHVWLTFVIYTLFGFPQSGRPLSKTVRHSCI